MKITYEFDKETVEIEVNEKWGQIVLELDRLEYNNNQTETRRHSSLFDFSPESKIFSDSIDVLGEVILNADYANLHKAIDMLKPRHRYLIKEHFIKGRKQNDIAIEEGLSAVAIHKGIKCALKKLKKFL